MPHRISCSRLYIQCLLSSACHALSCCVDLHDKAAKVWTHEIESSCCTVKLESTPQETCQGQDCCGDGRTGMSSAKQAAVQLACTMQSKRRPLVDEQQSKAEFAVLCRCSVRPSSTSTHASTTPLACPLWRQLLKVPPSDSNSRSAQALLQLYTQYHS